MNHSSFIGTMNMLPIPKIRCSSLSGQDSDPCLGGGGFENTTEDNNNHIEIDSNNTLNKSYTTSPPTREFLLSCDLGSHFSLFPPLIPSKKGPPSQTHPIKESKSLRQFPSLSICNFSPQREDNLALLRSSEPDFFGGVSDYGGFFN